MIINGINQFISGSLLVIATIVLTLVVEDVSADRKAINSCHTQHKIYAKLQSGQRICLKMKVIR
jgi:hypothetical protein